MWWNKIGKLFSWIRISPFSFFLLFRAAPPCVENFHYEKVHKSTYTNETNRALFRGENRDDWPAPAAHYELAVLAWKESCDPKCWPEAEEKIEAFRREKVAECEKYLEEVRNWEAFVLDARVGMKVQTGADTIGWLKGKKGWAS